VSLALFLFLGGAPLIHVVRQIWAFQMLQRDGRPVEATVSGRFQQRVLGIWQGELECIHLGASGQPERVWLSVDRSWWQASPLGSKVTITTCEETPGQAALGQPWEMQLGVELGLSGYGMLLLGLLALLVFGARLRPFFRDVTLVSLGTPVSGRVVGKSWMLGRRMGRKVTLPMVHLYFRDPFGVERVRTQIVDGDTWARVTEGESMTVLVCPRRRGWFAAYPLLLAEAAPPAARAAVALRSGRM